MRRMRGFKLGRKLVKVWRWALKRKSRGYLRLSTCDHEQKSKTMTKICNWGRRLGKTLCPSRRPLLSNYSSLEETPLDAKPVTVPKGHLAVYVGRKEDDTQRYLVPVIYFNHPLFGQLLREAEEEFGYHHQGGITIPCRVSDFENVQMKIAAGQGFPKSSRKRLF
ncbi:auxin-responsive protein SAUR36-like [Aristolochia californica]|uniref:auxin-responsive protein SAUR36-like n=1 Tax=Aristolochia californica TaxID=171875 RepID=UPI0035E0F91C